MSTTAFEAHQEIRWWYQVFDQLTPKHCLELGLTCKQAFKLLKTKESELKLLLKIKSESNRIGPNWNWVYVCHKCDCPTLVDEYKCDNCKCDFKHKNPVRCVMMSIRSLIFFPYHNEFKPMDACYTCFECCFQGDKDTVKLGKVLCDCYLNSNKTHPWGCNLHCRNIIRPPIVIPSNTSISCLNQIKRH